MFSRQRLPPALAEVKTLLMLLPAWRPGKPFGLGPFVGESLKDTRGARVPTTRDGEAGRVMERDINTLPSGVRHAWGARHA